MQLIVDTQGASASRGCALRVLEQEVSPTFQRLGDLRELAVTKRKVADIRGQHGC